MILYFKWIFMHLSKTEIQFRKKENWQIIQFKTEIKLISNSFKYSCY